MPNDRDVPSDRTDRTDRNAPDARGDRDASTTGRAARGAPSAGNEDEPRSERIDGRSFAGASYGATEREQTRDLRKADPAEEGDVADGGYSDEIENDDSGE